MKLIHAAFTIILLLSFQNAFASEPEKPRKLNYQFYGFVRGDASFDTRQTVGGFENLFLLYPMDILEDANGNDLNKISNSGFYSFNSRAGVSVSGLKAFNADLIAQMEADFAGFSGQGIANSTVLRIRHANLKMIWEKSSLTIGQTWHPMFGPVTPNVISLSVGAPFNPFNRSPLVRFNYNAGKFTFSGAGIWQFQFASQGPSGRSIQYQRQAIPELYFGVDYKPANFTAGVGFNYLTLKPRSQSAVGNDIYRVHENISSSSFTAYLGYSKNLFSISAKTIYGQNLAHLTMLGGYGVTRIDPATGKREYTNFSHSTSWLNISYGKKYIGNIFAGYTKNLGSRRALVDESLIFGDGLKLNDLYRLCGTFTYNIPHFLVGVEYEMTCAGYGNPRTFDLGKGRYGRSHSVTNHRVVGVISYIF